MLMVSHSGFCGKTPSSDGSQLDVLFSSLKQIQQSESRFTETQYDVLLELSFQKKGTMKYVAPNYFAQFYETPIKGQMIYSNSNVVIEFPDKKLTLDARNYPQVLSFSRSILNILNGDKAALEKDFEFNYTSSESDHWELTLIPRQALAKYIQAISIKGQQNTINSLLFTQRSGDWRELILNPISIPSLSGNPS